MSTLETRLNATSDKGSYSSRAKDQIDVTVGARLIATPKLELLRKRVAISCGIAASNWRSEG